MAVDSVPPAAENVAELTRDPLVAGVDAPATEKQPESRPGQSLGASNAQPEEAQQTPMGALFKLDTSDIPTIPFDVNGQRYELRTMAHLSPDEEAEARYLFRRDDELVEQFRKTAGKDKEKLLDINNKLRDIRVKIIVMMSNLPEDLVRQLKVHQQGKILQYIGSDPEAVIKEAAEASGEDIREL